MCVYMCIYGQVKRPVAWDPATLGAPRAATGGATQAPPPAKLTLPLAKLQALAVNEKQWLSPAASSTSSSSSSPEPQWPLKVRCNVLATQGAASICHIYIA